MSINVGEADIIVDADASPVLPKIRSLMASIDKLATREGDKVGRSFASSMSKSSEKILSKFGAKVQIIGALVPLATSAVSALAGAVTALLGSTMRAIISSASFVGVMGATAQAALVAKLAFSGMGDAIKGDAEALAKLTPAARETALAFRSLGGAWGEVKETIQEAAFKGLADDVSRLGTTYLPLMRNQLGVTGGILNKLMGDIMGFATGEGTVKKFNAALAGNNRIFDSLRQSAVPFLAGILNLYRALQPAAQRLADGIAATARSFAEWTRGENFMQNVNRYMKDAATSAGLLWGVLKNLGVAIWNILNGSAGAGDGLLQTLNDLTARFAAWTGTVEGQNAISNWAEQGVAAMEHLGRILGTMGGVFSALFNPAIFQGFLNVISQLTPSISIVAGTIQSALMPVLTSIGDAIAEHGPKLAGLFAALSPILTGVGMIIGQLISQSMALLGTIASVITPVVAAISNFIGPILQKFAPIIATIILSFTTWGASLIRLIPVIGRFLAPVVQFTSYLLRQLGPALSKIGALFGTIFRGMLSAARPVLSGISRLVSTAFGAVRTVVTTIVRAVVNAVRSNFQIVATVTRTIFNGVRTVIAGVMGAIRSVISAGVSAVRSIFSGLSSIVGAVTGIFGRVVSAVSSRLTNITNLVRELPGKLVGFIVAAGSSMYNAGSALFEQLGAGVEAALNKVKDKVTAGLNWIKDKLPGSPIKDGPLVGWNNGGAGKKLMGLLADGIAKGIPGVQAAVNETVALIARGFQQIEVGDAVKGVTEAFERVNAAVTDQVTKSFDAEAAAFKSTMDKRKRLQDKEFADREKTLRQKFDGKDQRKRLAKELKALEAEQKKANRALEKEAKTHNKGMGLHYRAQETALQQLAGAQRAQIMAMANTWDLYDSQLNGPGGIREQLASWQSELETRVSQMVSFASGIRDKIVSSVMGPSQDVSLPLNFEGIVSGLEGQLANATEFGDLLDQLVAAGLDPTTFEQIASQGVEGLQAARAVLAGGAAGVQQIAALQGAISAQAERSAEVASQYLYGAGVNIAQGFVDDLQNQESTLVTQMQTLGTALAEAIQTALAGLTVPVSYESTTAAGGDGGGKNTKHAWVQKSKSNKKCAVCGKPRAANVHTNAKNNNWTGSLSTMAGWGLFGENGPELVRMPGGARTFPAQQTERILEKSGGGGKTEIHIHTTSADPEAIAMMVMNRMARGR